jgi:hypothetical protein
MRIRRFDQFIRHADHFGKYPHHLDECHQIRRRFQTQSKDCFRERKNSHLIESRENEMFDVGDTLRSRRILTLVFAFLSGISAVSTAVVPAILH